MLMGLLRKIFGTKNDRIIKQLKKEVDQVNALEEAIANYSDEELKNQTKFFRQKLSEKTNLDILLHEAFATLREVSKRVLKMRHFDVQIIAGIILHKGMIAEMKTGEGKTLASSLAIYLNALKTQIHVVTANEYLAKRDASMMSEIMNFLDLNVSVIYNGMSQEDKILAYKADVIYGTSSEFGFDYLRDNMRYTQETIQNPSKHYVIVDEVDSILIDEARTPLVISGPVKYSQNMYKIVNQFVSQLTSNHYEFDENQKNIFLTDEGIELAEKYFVDNKIIQDNNKGIYDVSNIKILHLINQSLKAHFLFKKDIEYVVKNGIVYIVDSLTGRIMDGRRYSDGLHQAIEEKEGVEVQEENKTLASITIQNYFKMYTKIAGMTGTAMTEAAELKDIYNLDVVSVPTNNKVIRIDKDDKIYGTLKDKNAAILKLIKLNHAKGRPILIGTASIASSEQFSELLHMNNIPHNVLNAKNHEREAYIIAQAGKFGAVTIATNMAGRGTDIILGGTPNSHLLSSSEIAQAKETPKHILNFDKVENYISEISINQAMQDMELDNDEQNNLMQEILEENEKNTLSNDNSLEEKNNYTLEKQKVIEAGGLLVIGTERHESRRIDNQLRGRGGRQGDPGMSVFYLSLEDTLMKMLINENTAKMLNNLGLKDGEAIHHPFITRGISKTQQRIESMNYESRKSLIKFDNVINRQRKIIYEYRDKILLIDEDLYDIVSQILESWLKKQVQHSIPENSFKEDWDLKNLAKHLSLILDFKLDLEILKEDLTIQELEYLILKQIEIFLFKKIFDANDEISNVEEEVKRIFKNNDRICYIIKVTLLQCIDLAWQDHINTLDGLKQNMYMRSYGQKDPFIEYNRETFELFEKTLDKIEEIFIANYSRLNLSIERGDIFENNIQKMEKTNKLIEKEIKEVENSTTKMPELMLNVFSPNKALNSEIITINTPISANKTNTLLESSSINAPKTLNNESFETQEERLDTRAILDEEPKIQTQFFVPIKNIRYPKFEVQENEMVDKGSKNEMVDIDKNAFNNDVANIATKVDVKDIKNNKSRKTKKNNDGVAPNEEPKTKKTTKQSTATKTTKKSIDIKANNAIKDAKNINIASDARGTQALNTNNLDISASKDISANNVNAATASTPPSATVPLSRTQNMQEKILHGEIKRNDPCPCGSGFKYKYCHGNLMQ